MQVDKIFIYPIKSGAAVSVAQAQVESRGLRDDRRWMLVDNDSRFITGRQYPQITQVMAIPTGNGLELRAPGMPVLHVENPPDSAKTVRVQVWKDAVCALVADDRASGWLSEFLSIPVTLVYQGGSSHRPIIGPGSQAGDEVSFADGYPVLALGTASLDDLNARLKTGVPAEQFRPNIVIRTDSAYMEDAWTSAEINGILFENAKLCTRCVFTTVDPATGTKATSGEPFRTLRSYRFDRESKGVIFGVNWIPRNTGMVRLGDRVHAAAKSAGKG